MAESKMELKKTTIPWISVLLFLFFLAFFVRTSSPNVQFGDNAEFVTAAWVLGICHNPGYPLQIIIGNTIERLLPIASVSARMNLLSGLAGALAGLIMFHLLIRLHISVYASFSALALFVLSPLHWGQSTLFEVYTIDGLWILVNLFLLLKAFENYKWALLFCFTTAIAPILHLSQILYWPVYVMAIVLVFRKHPAKHIWLIIILLFCLAFSVMI
ncbi:DUF2723 domain-containing protein, partial [bacterium]|nr:DUF2723 domain-containing protein [candidate division CSSED10-310 bacterium]